jgi:mannan endo-1,6-alpha-mannosidase
MAASIKWMPQLYDDFMPYLRASAAAAASQCTGSADGIEGNVCGFAWTEAPTWDGTYGFGQQMDALEVIQANLIQQARHPVTAKNGGISHGNPSAGTEGTTADGAPPTKPVTTADRAGAGIVTAVVLIIWFYGAYFMLT